MTIKLCVARFILIEFTEAGESLLGYFQHYIMSKEIIGIDQFIGEADHINKGIGIAAIKLFLDDIQKAPPLSGGARFIV